MAILSHLYSGYNNISACLLIYICCLRRDTGVGDYHIDVIKRCIAGYGCGIKLGVVYKSHSFSGGLDTHVL